MNPPLRIEQDRRTLIEALRDGTIDCIATDHAPHTNYEKDKEFDFAPFGIIGLETALAVVFETLHHREGFALSEVIALLTCKPAAILKLPAGTLAPGANADVTIFDPDERWVVDAQRLESKSSNSPWLGREMRGRVKCTIVGGKTVFENGRVLG
jgi:dihydroorotase